MNVTLPCGCNVDVLHTEGEQMVTCRHGRYKAKAKWVCNYVITECTTPEAAIQQAAVVARTVNGELSGV